MNARDNPFAPCRLERLLAFDPALAGTTWEALEARWQSLGHRAAITGPHGSGKTTLLDAFACRLCERGEPPLRLFFNEEHRRLSPADRETLRQATGRILLIDGDEHLPWRERRELGRALRTASKVLLARHRRGLWPELIRLRATPRLAFELLERIAPSGNRAFILNLFHAKKGNLRELWLACYDLAAGGKYFGTK